MRIRPSWRFDATGEAAVGETPDPVVRNRLKPDIKRPQDRDNAQERRADPVLVGYLLPVIAAAGGGR